jgi:hypothetical protein
MSSKGSKVATVAAAGTLTLATAISAVVVTHPSASPASATADAAFMTTVSQQSAAQAAQADSNGSQQATLFSHVRAYQAKHFQQEAAAAKAAAARVAAAKAAAAKAAAAKAAAQKAAAAKAAAAQAAAQRAAAQPTQQAQSAQATAVTTPSGSPQQVAEQMLSQFGWSTSQFSCLQPLWQQESGWSLTAENPSSGAYGIPQALPGSKMASAGPDWQTDAATQIRWGLTYIKDIYGSPCGAWDHEEADGWY